MAESLTAPQRQDPPVTGTEIETLLDPDWDWNSAGQDPPEALRALFARQVARSEGLLADALAQAGPDRHSDRAVRGGPVSVRWILVHLIEEYARHCGHADLIRESIDGLTGE